MTFIRPILEYADVVWCNITKYEEDELKKIQLDAARIVTGTTKLVSIENLYKETGWETLSSRRRQHKLTLYYKMTKYLTPAYLSSLPPPLVGAMSRYPLRNSEQYQTIDAKSQLYYNSFLPLEYFREHSSVLSISFFFQKEDVNATTCSKLLLSHWQQKRTDTSC